MRTDSIMLICGLLSAAATPHVHAQTDAGPAFVEIMNGLGPAPDMFICPAAETYSFDAVAITFVNADSVTLFSARTLSNTPNLAPGVIGLVEAGESDAEGTIDYIVELDGPVPVGEWTRIELDVEFAVYEADHYERTIVEVWVAHLPCDVDQDGQVTAGDATAFGQEYRGRRAVDLLDLDGDGNVTVRDATTFGDQWHGRNGLAPARGSTLPTPPTDCNGNGVSDAIELAEGTMQDMNANAVLDICEPSTGVRRR